MFWPLNCVVATARRVNSFLEAKDKEFPARTVMTEMAVVPDRLLIGTPFGCNVALENAVRSRAVPATRMGFKELPAERRYRATERVAPLALV